MKRVFCLLLALAMMVACAGCFGPSQEDLLNKVAGTWTCRYAAEQADVEEFLANYDFYDEEIALVKNSQLWSVRTMRIGTDKTISWSEPTEELKQCVREFFTDVYDELYEGRASLAGLYEEDVSQMSKDAFLSFYASAYNCVDFASLLDLFADNAYDYPSLINYRSGTFTINSLTMVLDTDDAENDGAVTYKAEGNQLTLTFADGTEVYTKSN